MKAATLLVALGVLAACEGCTQFVSSETIKYLAQSDRSWCSSATTPWGKGTIAGTGARNATVTCSQEGLTVRSQEGP